MILQDRVAIVTASGSGIGRAGAAKMASEGATVILADLSPERSEEAASQIRDAGDRAEAHPTDVTDAEAVVALVEETLSRHGRIDILHSHAGVQVGGGVILLTSSNAGLVRNRAARPVSSRAPVNRVCQLKFRSAVLQVPPGAVSHKPRRPEVRATWPRSGGPRRARSRWLPATPIWY